MCQLNVTLFVPRVADPAVTLIIYKSLLFYQRAFALHGRQFARARVTWPCPLPATRQWPPRARTWIYKRRMPTKWRMSILRAHLLHFLHHNPILHLQQKTVHGDVSRVQGTCMCLPADLQKPGGEKSLDNIEMRAGLFNELPGLLTPTSIPFRNRLTALWWYTVQNRRGGGREGEGERVGLRMLSWLRIIPRLIAPTAWQVKKWNLPHLTASASSHLRSSRPMFHKTLEVGQDSYEAIVRNHFLPPHFPI